MAAGSRGDETEGKKKKRKLAREPVRDSFSLIDDETVKKKKKIKKWEAHLK